jgi:endoglucanase
LVTQVLETRRASSGDLGGIGRLSELRQHPDVLITVGLVMLALAAQAIRLWHDPSSFGSNEEGSLAVAGWAVLREGRLSPYTYLYDHGLAGPVVLGLWMALSGGPHAFGTAIDSGRVLMTLVHAASVGLLYGIVRGFGGSRLTAAFSAVLFAVSPLVLAAAGVLQMDTLTVFWLLTSLSLLLDRQARLSSVALSGVSFGLALLDGGTALVLAPGYLLLVLRRRRPHQGLFFASAWLLPMLMIASLYPLYAQLKGELLPFGDTPHVSLLQPFNPSWNLPRWDSKLQSWLAQDAALVIGGALAMLVNLAPGEDDPETSVAGLLGVLAFIAALCADSAETRGAALIAPFACMNVGLALDRMRRWRPAFLRSAAVGSATALVVVGFLLSGQYGSIAPRRATLDGGDAVTWLKRTVPADSRVIVPDTVWPDLAEPGAGGPGYADVTLASRVSSDSDVRDGLLHDDWQSIQYIVTSADDSVSSFEATDNRLALAAAQHAYPVAEWPPDADAATPATLRVWRVTSGSSPDDTLLRSGDAYLHATFDRDGAYGDGSGTVTSEAQSYALLRAVWLGDAVQFARVWHWTQTRLQTSSGVLAWEWRDGAVADPHSATDADSDVALALLLAGKRWHNADWSDAGVSLVQAIWQQDVALVGSTPYVTAGDWATSGPVLGLNPSYLSPYAYRVFAQVDPEHDWSGAVDSSYQVLSDSSSAPLGSSQSSWLPPDWIGLDSASGTFVPFARGTDDTTQYSYDAPRTYWRVALDAQWSGDRRAEAYLRSANFLRDEVVRKGDISAVYGHDGSIVEGYPSDVGRAGALAVLLTVDPDVAQQLRARLVDEARLTDSGTSWGDPTNLYQQEWAWFGDALTSGALVDLWNQS